MAYEEKLTIYSDLT